MEFLRDRRKKQQFIFSYITFMLNGMLALSIGSLLPFIRDARGLEYTFCGLLVSLHSVGNLLSSFFGGDLPHHGFLCRKADPEVSLVLELHAYHGRLRLHSDALGDRQDRGERGDCVRHEFHCGSDRD